MLVGSITPWPGAIPTIPANWLLCDGTSYLVAAQPTLFAAIGYTFGGAGVNFNVPDARNRLVFGVGTALALAANDGRAEVARNPRSHLHLAGAGITSSTGAGILPMAHTPASVATDPDLFGAIQIAGAASTFSPPGHTHIQGAPLDHAWGAVNHTHAHGNTFPLTPWPPFLGLYRIIYAGV